MSKEAGQLLATASPNVQPLAERAYDKLHAAFPEAEITVDEENIGFGTGPGYDDLVFVLTPLRDYVRLGISRATELPDPAGLLEGRGKLHRHVKLRRLEDLDQPELDALIKIAVARAHRH